MKLSNKAYDVLKWVGLIACPALAVFYSTVGPLWGWPQVDAVVTTINAIGVLIGALIGVSTSAYNKEQAKAEVDKPHGTE